MNINDLESQLNLETRSRFLEIYFNNPTNIEDLKKDLTKEYPEELIYTWSDLNKPLFSAASFASCCASSIALCASRTCSSVAFPDSCNLINS